MCNATRVSRESSAKAGKVTFVNYTILPTAPRSLGSRHYIIFCIFYLGLLTTDVARSGKRQVPFLKPYLGNVTDTWPTSRTFVANVFPKDIRLWSAHDSNAWPSAPDPDSLTTRPRDPLYIINQHVFIFKEIDYVLQYFVCMFVCLIACLYIFLIIQPKAFTFWYIVPHVTTNWRRVIALLLFFFKMSM